MATATDTRPAWERFDAMSVEVHDMLIGAAQCRNHLRVLLDAYDLPAEVRGAVEDALERLTRVGI